MHQSANRAGHPPGVQGQRRGMADFSAVLSGSEIQERGHGVHPRPILRKNEEFPTQNHLPGLTLQLSGATQLRPVGAGQATLPHSRLEHGQQPGKVPDRRRQKGPDACARDASSLIWHRGRAGCRAGTWNELCGGGRARKSETGGVMMARKKKETVRRVACQPERSVPLLLACFSYRHRPLVAITRT